MTQASKKSVLAIAVMSSLILTSTVFAATHLVVSSEDRPIYGTLFVARSSIQYPSIQAAIDAAVDGDTIVLAPGKFTGEGNRDLDFNGLAITVRSTDPNDPDIVAATIIDCQGTEVDPHRGFNFNNNEDVNSVLAGLTITNGYADNGGGVYCSNSSPTITKCRIQNNITSGWSDGGGIYLRQSNVTITECILNDNVTSGDGGGISCWWYSKPIIKDCNIYDNSATHGGGGGISSFRSEPQIANCTINNNMARYGAGIFGDHDEESPTISHCIISNNASDYNAGGGIQGCNGPITNCIITGNTGVYPGGGGLNRCNGPITNCIITNNTVSNGDGGGVYRCKGPISNCLISGNLASDDGGGIDITACSNTITNCTIIGNSAGGYGGGIYAWFDSNVTVSNCILWNNSGNGHEVALDYDQYNRPCTLTILYGNIEGGQAEIVIDPTCALVWGAGNINADPCFANPDADDFHLKSQGGRYWAEHDVWVLDDVTSPCIDAGDPAVNSADEPSPNGGRVNMGVHGQSPYASLSNCNITGDINCDRRVNMLDFAILADNWLVN